MAEKNNLSEIDFNALHGEQCRRSSFGPRTSADWDRRAKRRQHRELDSDYSRAFLERVDLAEAKTALDVGCGTGNLAVPLAKRLRKVHALDYSPAMLRLLAANCRKEGVGNVVVHRLSWDDPWKGVPKADVVVCSRALGVEDLRGALEKLHGRCRLRAYATVHASGHFLDDEVRARLDRHVEPRPNYLYAVNVLYQMGVKAKVDFIRSTGGGTYATEEEYLAAIRWRVGELSPKEERRLKALYRELPRGGDGQAQPRRDFEWALLSWEKQA